ncbi:MAG TPA: GDP-L-fucose synthase [Rhizomicrobium sp.]|jgi:GDP-L-fucose synthase|nr:GDP-L-fucose synthase [Rhizomicrobium sp.]
MAFNLTGKKVWVAGHTGMVGAALVRALQPLGCEIVAARSKEVDLRRQDQVDAWVAKTKPDAVFLAAATVGGIKANSTRPAEFIYDNMMIEANVVEAARRNGTAKLMLLGSSCIYPKLAVQPLTEDALLTGPLEPTNEWYAIAKIAGIKLCQAYRKQYGCDFISVMPTNLYGPGDNFDPEQSHVVPGLIRKMHDAKAQGLKDIAAWGTGTPRREFLHVDDMADACVFLMQTYSGEGHLNIGTGEDITIRELVETVKSVVGFDGAIVFDTAQPDGTPRKLLDVSRLHALGWRHRIAFGEGLRQTYRWFQDNYAGARLTVSAG